MGGGGICAKRMANVCEFVLPDPNRALTSVDLMICHDTSHSGVAKDVLVSCTAGPLVQTVGGPHVCVCVCVNGSSSCVGASNILEHEISWGDLGVVQGKIGVESRRAKD